MQVKIESLKNSAAKAMTEVNRLKGSSSPQKDPEKVLEEIS